LDDNEDNVIEDWHLVGHIQLRAATAARATKELPQGIIRQLQHSGSCRGDRCDGLQAIRLWQRLSAQPSVTTDVAYALDCQAHRK